jgi:hypothetical protein
MNGDLSMTSIKRFNHVPTAPMGSPAWCRNAHYQIGITKRQAIAEISHLKQALLDFKQNERWRLLTDQHGAPFQSWQHYVQAPEPHGLGMSVAIVAEVIDAVDHALTVLKGA